MKTEPNESQPGAPARLVPTRPLYWSVRRELWENRSIYLAPAVVAGVVLFGFAMTAIGLPNRRRAAMLLDPAGQRAAIEMPYDIVALMIMLTAFLVAIFYCLDALRGERRDRSILFWKSLPVSDFTSVLAKALIPLAILPVVTFVLVVATQFCMLLITTAVLLPSGLGGTTWRLLPLGQLAGILFYTILTSALWHVPFYGWLLLVSGWARRATFLWAVLPWIALCMTEKVAFNTGRLASLLSHRIFGSFRDAFVIGIQPRGAGIPLAERLAQLAPLRFLSNPGLWIGLAVGAALFFAAVRLRRYRGPL